MCLAKTSVWLYWGKGGGLGGGVPATRGGGRPADHPPDGGAWSINHGKPRPNRSLSPGKGAASKHAFKQKPSVGPWGHSGSGPVPGTGAPRTVRGDYTLTTGRPRRDTRREGWGIGLFRKRGKRVPPTGGREEKNKPRRGCIGERPGVRSAYGPLGHGTNAVSYARENGSTRGKDSARRSRGGPRPTRILDGLGLGETNYVRGPDFFPQGGKGFFFFCRREPAKGGRRHVSWKEAELAPSRGCKLHRERVGWARRSVRWARGAQNNSELAQGLPWDGGTPWGNGQGKKTGRARQKGTRGGPGGGRAFGHCMSRGGSGRHSGFTRGNC